MYSSPRFGWYGANPRNGPVNTLPDGRGRGGDAATELCLTLTFFSNGALAAEETFFFDTFFLLVGLADFTVFFEEDFFAAAFFAETFFAEGFLAGDFFDAGFDRFLDAALREDARALVFALFFLLAAPVAFFAAAFFAGIARASEGLNETVDYT